MADVWHGASCLQRVRQRTQNSSGLATWSDLVEMWLVLFWDITPLGVLCGKNETLAPTSCGLLVVMKLTDRKLPDRCFHLHHHHLHHRHHHHHHKHNYNNNTNNHNDNHNSTTLATSATTTMSTTTTTWVLCTQCPRLVSDHHSQPQQQQQQHQQQQQQRQEHYHDCNKPFAWAPGRLSGVSP